MIALDSIAWHYSLSLSGIPREYFVTRAADYTRRLARQTMKLVALSVENRAPLLIVTWPKSPVERRLGLERMEEEELGDRLKRFQMDYVALKHSMLGGSRLPFGAKVILYVLRMAYEETGEVVGILAKHKLRPTGYGTFYCVTEKGIEDLPPDSPRRRIFHVRELTEFVVEKKEKK